MTGKWRFLLIVDVVLHKGPVFPSEQSPDGTEKWQKRTSATTKNTK